MKRIDKIKAVITDSNRAVYFSDIPLDLTNTPLQVFIHPIKETVETNITNGVQYGNGANQETTVYVNFTNKGLEPGLYRLSIKTPEITIVVNDLDLKGPDGRTYKTYGVSSNTTITIMSDENGNIFVDDNGNILTF